MLRSFDYAAHTVLRRTLAYGATGKNQHARPIEAINFWTGWVEASYLSAYLRTAEPSGLLPQKPANRRLLVTSYLMEKAAYEIGYEVNNRPEWVGIPIRGLLRILDTLSESGKEGGQDAQAS
jgi:maltose alpha-D-glucosyltransferase/alpha-amylase